MNTVTIQPEFRVAIPSAICQSLHLRLGQRLQIRQINDRIELLPYRSVKETLIKSFDKLRTNGKLLILLRSFRSPLVVSLSNHERNRLDQRSLKEARGFLRGIDADIEHEPDRI